MTRKRATKLLMACGLSRNQVNRLMNMDRPMEVTNQIHAAGIATSAMMMHKRGDLKFFDRVAFSKIWGVPILPTENMTITTWEEEPEWDSPESDTLSSPMEPTLITP